MNDYIIIIGSQIGDANGSLGSYSVILPMPINDGHTYIIRNAVRLMVTSQQLQVKCTLSPNVFVTDIDEYNVPVSFDSIPIGTSHTYVSSGNRYVRIQ